ncbi:hypothetical protein [Pelagibacterium lentulum]|uniref:Chromosome partition protein Smc n=1 Tax=Pelagibacterium lentulum TaxID=2029865 RepID=A0A916R9M1_9HYPH|nr:hypothetical protein [Pelagibacterium lentulum]GGA39914.1 hypothetical protein GCM10011499_06710 [Pelagibacterium lentulum]
MTFSGPQGLRALEDALKDVRREEDQITKRIARATERAVRLREAEAQSLRELSTLRLLPENQGDIRGRLSAAEAQAREMLKQHAAAMNAIEADLAEHEASLSRLVAERGKVLDRIGSHQANIDALAQTVRASLATDAAYADAEKEIQALSATLAEAEKKTKQAEADRVEKGRPYKADPLFMYLWDSGYGTPEYKGRNFTRVFDAMVARHIRFHDARPNFAMLNLIPERLAEHVEHLRDDLESAQDALEAIEVNALDKAGGKPAREALEALAIELDEIDARIVETEDRREALTQEQKQIAHGGDPTYEMAVSQLAKALGSVEIGQLVADARATATPEDDAIVERIDETRRRIRTEDAEIEDQRNRLRVLETRRRELEDMEFEFKKSRFDDPRSRFGEDKLVGDMLDEFLKGAISASAYWGHWRNSQGWAGTSGPIIAQPRDKAKRSGGFAVPPGGFSPRPRSGGSWSKPSGGGFSRPRSGGFSGGGFKTGGGFKGGGGFRTGGKF